MSEVQESTQVPEKQLYEYQPKDAEGSAIGRPYKFYYTDHQDLVTQLTSAKEAGDRYIHEVKTGKRQVKGEAAIEKPSFQPAAESAEDVEKRRREEFRSTAEKEFGASLSTVRDTLRRANDFDDYLIANQWAVNHEGDGYYICQENAQAIAQYLQENKLRLSEKNLDLAFEELKDSLKTKPVPSETPATPTRDSGANGATQQPRNNGATSGIKPGDRRIPAPSKTKLTTERFRAIQKMSAPEWKQLQRHSPDEAALYLEMKSGS